MTILICSIIQLVCSIIILNLLLWNRISLLGDKEKKNKYFITFCYLKEGTLGFNNAAVEANGIFSMEDINKISDGINTDGKTKVAILSWHKFDEP